MDYHIKDILNTFLKVFIILIAMLFLVYIGYVMGASNEPIKPTIKPSFNGQKIHGEFLGTITAIERHPFTWGNTMFKISTQMHELKFKAWSSETFDYGSYIFIDDKGAFTTIYEIDKFNVSNHEFEKITKNNK